MEPKAPSLQRLNSNVKRAVLIPQKTNLRFDLNPVDSASDASDAVNLRKLSQQRLPRVSSHRGDAPLRGSSNNLVDPMKVTGDAIERFLECVPAIGLAREDSKIMRSRVIEEMYRIQERATITPEERQKLVQLAMSMDAPRLARKLVSEAKEHHEESESAGAFLTGQQLSVRNLEGAEDKSQSSSSSPTSPTPRPIRSNSLLASEDDAVFCKAFDEVERIRQRILQRANAPLASSSAASQATHRDRTPPPPPTHPHPYPAPLLREASASSIPSRRSSIDLQPIHEFTVGDLLDDDANTHPPRAQDMSTANGEARAKERQAVIHSLDMLVDHIGISPRLSEDPVPASAQSQQSQRPPLLHLPSNTPEGMYPPSDQVQKGFAQVRDELLRVQRQLSRHGRENTKDDEDSEALEQLDRFPSLSVDMFHAAVPSSHPSHSLHSTESSTSHLFHPVSHPLGSTTLSSSHSASAMLTSTNSHMPPLSRTPEPSLSSSHASYSLDSFHSLPSSAKLGGGQAASSARQGTLPPLGLELKQAKAMLLTPLTDWIRMSKQLPDPRQTVPASSSTPSTSSRTPQGSALVTPSTVAGGSVQGASATASSTPMSGALISPRILVPAGQRLSPVRRNSSHAASHFSFEDPLLPALHTSTSQTGFAPSYPIADELLVTKVKKSLQVLSDQMTPIHGSVRTPRTPRTPRSNCSASNQGTPRGANNFMVSQSLASVKLSAPLPARPATTATAGAGVSNGTSSAASTSPGSAMKAAGELALQGAGPYGHLSRDNSAMSTSESLASTSYNLPVASTPAGRSSKLAFAAALNAGDAVGKLMAEMFSQRK